MEHTSLPPSFEKLYPPISEAAALTHQRLGALCAAGANFRQDYLMYPSAEKALDYLAKIIGHDQLYIPPDVPVVAYGEHISMTDRRRPYYGGTNVNPESADSVPAHPNKSVYLPPFYECTGTFDRDAELLFDETSGARLVATLTEHTWRRISDDTTIHQTHDARIPLDGTTTLAVVEKTRRDQQRIAIKQIMHYIDGDKRYIRALRDAATILLESEQAPQNFTQLPKVDLLFDYILQQYPSRAMHDLIYQLYQTHLDVVGVNGSFHTQGAIYEQTLAREHVREAELSSQPMSPHVSDTCHVTGTGIGFMPSPYDPSTRCLVTGTYGQLSEYITIMPLKRIQSMTLFRANYS